MDKSIMLQTLKKYFGYDTFRPMQEEIITHVLDGGDALVLMPTGGGKSICYQIPALIKSGTAIVISPLISLMKDQVESLRSNGVEAAALNSSNSDEENYIIRRKCINGDMKVLYISPERLMNEVNLLFRQMSISLFAIDEAHCISQWGHDFRPEYTQLELLKQEFPNVPMMALTATADKITRDDILSHLKLRNPRIFITSFDRPNLSLDVKRGYQKKEKMKSIMHFIDQHYGQSGIIYCMSKKTCEEVAALLQVHRLKATAYHAGLSPKARNQAQEDFINDRVQIVCATIAFGMGIDKSNVRWVIHYNLPKSMESFYQEIGRAGRDGMKSDTLLFYSLGDIILLEKFAADSGQKEINHDKLRRMQQYAEADICRRRILLNYFGETTAHDCGNCDVCRNPPQKFNGTILVQKALSAILRTEEKLSTYTLVDVLRGNSSADVVRHGFDKIKTFGAGRDVPARDWQDYLLQMLQMGFIEIAYNENNHLKITPAGNDVLYGRAEAQLVVIKREPKAVKGRKPAAPTRVIEAFKVGQNEENMELFEALRTLRKQIADQLGYPAYIVLADKVLHLLATIRPKTIDAFGNISGVGAFKKEKYGKEFVELISQYD